MIARLLRHKCAVIVAAAFAVKALVLMQLWDHPLLQPRGELDTAYYVALGQKLAAEGPLAPIGAFFVSPLYVYFLAAIFAAGGSLIAAQVVQIALGAAAVGLLFATTRHWFGERAAMVAASLAILTGLFSFNEVLILQSALDPFLVACALYALTRTTTGPPTSASAAAAGAALGLLALNRPNALVFAVAAAVAVTINAGRRGVIVAAALVAVLGVNAARNYAVSGDLVVIASHGGLNFYIGNHDRADGTYTPVPGVTPSIAGQAGESRRVAESMVGRALSPAEVSNFFAARALDWMEENPGDALRLTLRKIAILFNRIDVPLNYSYAYFAKDASPMLRALAVGPWLLLPLGVIGLLWPSLRVRREGYWVWAMFVPLYGAAVVLFFVTDRYRMPLLVPLCATAGAVLLRMFDLLRARRHGALAAATAAVATAAVVTFADLGLDDGRSGEQTRLAVLLIEQGAPDEALQYVDQIARDHSHPGVLRFRVAQSLLDAGPRPAIQLALGEALLRSGRAPDAVTHLEAAYHSTHDISRSAPLLIRALVFSGRAQDAVKRLVQIPSGVAMGSSAPAEVALDFGTLALEHGTTDDAIRWLRIAVEHAPERAEALEKLGVAILLNGDALGARPYLERAVQRDPTSASAHLNLAVAYAELAKFSEARRQTLEALRLDPGERRAAALLEALPK
jgi:tetratricopeptide (TPR) repeat protein